MQCRPPEPDDILLSPEKSHEKFINLKGANDAPRIAKQLVPADALDVVEIVIPAKEGLGVEISDIGIFHGRKDDNEGGDKRHALGHARRGMLQLNASRYPGRS